MVPSPFVGGPAADLSLQYARFVTRSNFPVVLLRMAGNCPMVSTAIYTDAIYADKVFSIDLRLGIHGPENVLLVARVFMAIRRCADPLRLHYQGLQTLSGTRPSVMYPNPIADPPENQAEIPQLEFFAKVDRAKGTQLAIVNEDNKRHAVYLAKRTCPSTPGTSKEIILVKFTTSYCEPAHNLLAKQNPPLVPALYSCNHIVGGLYMVVMEYLSDASPLHRFFPPSPVPHSLNTDVVRRSLTRALELLHGQGLSLVTSANQMYFTLMKVIVFSWWISTGLAKIQNPDTLLVSTLTYHMV